MPEIGNEVCFRYHGLLEAGSQEREIHRERLHLCCNYGIFAVAYFLRYSDYVLVWSPALRLYRVLVLVEIW